jgi:hypothetical protein
MKILKHLTLLALTFLLVLGLTHLTLIATREISNKILLLLTGGN